MVADAATGFNADADARGRSEAGLCAVWHAQAAMAIAANMAVQT